MAPRLFVWLAPLLVVSALTAGPAAAQTSQNAYSTPAGEVQADVSGSNNGPTTNPSSQGPRGETTRSTSAIQLPFTGLDVGLLLTVGAMLLAVGVAISRLSRRAQ